MNPLNSAITQNYTPDRPLKKARSESVASVISEWEKSPNSPIQIDSFICLLKQAVENFPTKGDCKKITLQSPSKLYVSTRVKGDLKNLLSQLRELQKQGLLDENFRCHKDTYLVFMGDYTNGCSQPLHVLEILIRLHQENPTNVVLLRCHLDTVKTNEDESRDPAFLKFLQSKDSFQLDAFYSTLPIALYLNTSSFPHEFMEISSIFQHVPETMRMSDTPPLKFLSDEEYENLEEEEGYFFLLETNMNANGFIKSTFIALQNTYIQKNESIGELKEEIKIQNLVTLLSIYENLWDQRTKEYKPLPFHEKTFKELLEKATQAISLPIYPEGPQLGYIEKRDLPKNSQIFVRADLHGDLKSLIENLKVLQKKGLLDENFECQEGTYLVFLGDYVDRGYYSIQVLQILALLRLENPDNVFLIRGNHEYALLNLSITRKNPVDFHFNHFLQGDGLSTKNINLLERFYQSMPLAIYLSEEGDRRQYVQFSHGLFELHIDLESLLTHQSSHVQRLLPLDHRTFRLSARIVKLIESEVSTLTSKQLKAKASALRVLELHLKQKRNPENSPYNWGDVKPVSTLGEAGTRNWALSPEDIKHYFRTASSTHPVKCVLRGHQHHLAIYQTENKAIAITLPVGSDSGPYKATHTHDMSYILTTAAKVKDWNQVTLMRRQGTSLSTLFPPRPLREVPLT